MRIYLQGSSQSCDIELYVGTLLGTIIVPIFHLDVHTVKNEDDYRP